MVTRSDYIIKFINDLTGQEINLIYKQHLLRIVFELFLPSFRDKISIHEQLKQNNIRDYLVVDRDITIKAVIRDLSRFSDLELIKETLAIGNLASLKFPR